MVKRNYSYDKLRKWHDHDPQKWNEFQKRYKIDLVDKLDSLEIIKTLEKKQKIVTLLYAAKDKKLTHAIVLQQLEDVVM